MKIYENGDKFGERNHIYYTSSYPYYTRLTSYNFFYGKNNKEDWTDYLEIDTAFESKIFWVRKAYYESMGFFFCYKRNSRFIWQVNRSYLGARENVKRVLQPINCRKISCTFIID